MKFKNEISGATEWQKLEIQIPEFLNTSQPWVDMDIKMTFSLFRVHFRSYPGVFGVLWWFLDFQKNIIAPAGKLNQLFGHVAHVCSASDLVYWIRNVRINYVPK